MEEGLLIALTAVRMAVKNQIILGVLRDKCDYLADDYAEVARNQIALLVAENDDHATRFRAAHVAPAGNGADQFAAAEATRRKTLQQVHTQLAIALRALGQDDAEVMRIVETARSNAWHEIGDAWITKLTAQLPEPQDAEYERQRAGRLQEFVYIDLAGLILQHTG